MCLAVPGKIVELAGDSAVAEMHGNRIAISTVLTPEVRIGDWVLVHAGFAISILDAAAAAQTFSILADLDAAERRARNTHYPEEITHA